MVSGTGICWVKGTKWHQKGVINDCVLARVSIGKLVCVIGALHGDCLIAGFVGLQRVEDR